MKTKKSINLGLKILLLFSLFTLIVPNMSVIAACTGNGCRSYDPINQGCSNDAHTPDYGQRYKIGVGEIRVELRHSNVCDSFWTKVLSYSGQRSLLGHISEYGTAYHYYWNLNASSVNNTTNLYTDMISGTSNDLGIAHGWMGGSAFQGQVSGPSYVSESASDYGH